MTLKEMAAIAREVGVERVAASRVISHAPTLLFGVTLTGSKQPQVRSFTGSDPLAGAEVLLTVPWGGRWQLHAMRLVLVTDTTAVNREVDLVIDDGTNTLLMIEPPALQGLGGTRGYNYGTGFPSLNALTQEFLIPFPAGLMLQSGYRLRTVTTNLQAGDNYGIPRVLVEEWLDPRAGVVLYDGSNAQGEQKLVISPF